MKKIIVSFLFVLIAFSVYAQEENKRSILEILQDLPEEQQQKIISGELALKDLPAEIKKDIVKRILVSGFFDEQMKKSFENLKEDFNKKELAKPVKILFDSELMNIQIGKEQALRTISVKFQNAKIANISLEKAEDTDVDVIIAEETFAKMVSGEQVNILQDYRNGDVIIKPHGLFNRMKYGAIKLAMVILSLSSKFKNV